MNGRPYLQSELDYVKETYADTKSEEIAAHLERPISSIYKMATLLGIKKSQEFLLSDESGRLNKRLAEVGKAYRFQKGIVPVNKGKKQSEFMTQEGIERSKSTRFQKGRKNHNELNDGDKVWRADTNGNYYWRIRVAKGKWPMLHVYNWEQENGKVPEGHILVFRDGDRQNCHPSNMELITKAENMRRNSIQRYPTEIKQAMRTIGKLNRTIKKHE